MTNSTSRFLFLATIVLVIGIEAERVAAQRPQPPPNPKDGRRVEWEGWSFRWSVRRIEGLVLTDVRFRNRRVLKYAGLCELQAPYAHGFRTRDWSLKYGFGNQMQELIVGEDCYPGSECNAYDAAGREQGKRVVMMHEEPLGLQYFGKSGRAYGKMLVLWAMARFPGNGDGYAFILRWKFRNDGVLIPEVGATGSLQFPGEGRFAWTGNDDQRSRASIVGLMSNEHREKYGYLKDLKTGAPIFSGSHVHSFCFRLDFDIDGPADNAVEQFDYVFDNPGSDTARGQWTRIEKEAGLRANSESFRSWRVLNTKSKNALGNPRSYQLIPGGNGSYRGEAKNPFAQSDIWVTRSRPSEFPYSSADPRLTEKALPGYVNGESIDGTDVVIWYTLTFQHQPRAEDWFEMPAVWNSFKLIPRDFLDGTPLQMGRPK